MVILVRPEVAPQEETRTRWLFLTGVAAATLGAAVAVASLAAVTVLVWAAGPLATQGITAAPFRGAAALWLFAQRAPLAAGPGDLVLPPLAITAALVAVTVRVAAWAARRTRAHEPAAAAVVGSGVVVGHLLLAALAASFSARNGAGVDTGPALRAALFFALPCALAGIVPQTWPWATLTAKYGAEARRCVRAAGAGAIVLLAGGAAILLISLIWHAGRTGQLFDAVGGGMSGGAGTTLVCLAMAPNAVLWVLAFAAGPGFALGTDAGLGLGGLEAGALPAMPLFGALPGAGPLPVLAHVALMLPVAAGAAIGWCARPSGAKPRPRSELAAAAVAGVTCGLGLGVLAGLSGGGASGRLETVGPNLFAVTGALVGELTVVATVVAAGRLGYERMSGSPMTAPPSLIPAQARRKDAAAKPAEKSAVQVSEQLSPTKPAEAQEAHTVGVDIEDLEDTQEIPIIQFLDDDYDLDGST